MDERETKQLMEDVASVMKSLVSSSLAPVLARVAAIEAALKSTPVPKDGKSVTVEDVTPMIRAEVEKAAAGIVATIPDVAAMVADAVTKEADRLAAKAEPQVVTMTFDAEPLRQEIAALADQVKAIDVADAVNAAVAALPKPQDGKSVTADDLRPLITEEVSSAVAALPKARDGRDGIDGKDGIGLAGFFLDKDFNVVATTSDGTVHNLGCVKGEKGDPGRDGKDGMDGVSMSHFDTEMKDERTIVFKFVRDDSIVEMHEFSFPVLIDRGVWTERVYQKGDCVTWGGSLWICQRETSAKPDSPDSGWRLAVKKGRDGKDKA